MLPRYSAIQSTLPCADLAEVFDVASPGLRILRIGKMITSDMISPGKLNFTVAGTSGETVSTITAKALYEKIRIEYSGRRWASRRLKRS